MGSSRSTTSASWGAANAVFRYSPFAPSFDTASVASTKPRWFRHMIATPSPAPTPSAANPRAMALERRCTSAQLSSPISSTSTVRSGVLIEAAAIAAAGDAPQRASTRSINASLSGRTGRTIPASMSVFRLNGTSLSAPRCPSLIRRPTLLIGPVKVSAESFPASERTTALAYPRLIELDQHYRHARDPLPATDPAHALVGRRLDAHARRQRLGQVALHLRPVGSDPRLLADHRGVHVHGPPGQVAQRNAQQVHRVRLPPPLLLGRKQGAEIAQACGSEQGIDHRVAPCGARGPRTPRSAGSPSRASRPPRAHSRGRRRPARARRRTA